MKLQGDMGRIGTLDPGRGGCKMGRTAVSQCACFITSYGLVRVVAPEHPPKNTNDPFHLGCIAEKARRYASNNPWTSSSWNLLTPRKNLILLPAGFEKVVQCLESSTQKAIIMRKPEDIQPEWLAEDYSAIIIFSTAEFAGTTRWRGAWTLLMQAVARGCELFALAGPQHGGEWGRSVDLLRDLFEETVEQRPILASRLRCLLPLRSHQEMHGVGFRVLAERTSEQMKVLTQSAAKRFWTTTMVQHSAFLKLTPFKRISEMRINDSQVNNGKKGDRSCQNQRKYHPQHALKPHWRSQRQRKPMAEMPLQVMGNRMFKLVPVGRKPQARSHGSGGRATHGSRGPRHGIRSDVRRSGNA